MYEESLEARNTQALSSLLLNLLFYLLGILMCIQVHNSNIGPFFGKGHGDSMANTAISASNQGNFSL